MDLIDLAKACSRSSPTVLKRVLKFFVLARGSLGKSL